MPPAAVEFADIVLTLNGGRVTRRVPVRQHLIDFIREELGLTGSHLGCEHGVCGACSVSLDGEIVRGCLLLTVQCDGARVDTIEGLSESGVLTALQCEFHERNALQCGFCSPGMLMTALELIRANPRASREEIRVYMSGNFCRCTGYQSIIDAIEAVCRGTGRT